MMTATIPPAVARLCGDELCTRVPQLRDAVGHRQREAAREHAHALRGMAANFGLSGLALALAVLEATAKEGCAPLGPAFAAVEREIMPALHALGYNS
jgi:HPt (histidine-containing phosphotransfer) domain-containing protein